MTTTELINLLKKHEFGSITGKARTVNIYAEDQYGNTFLVFGGEDDELRPVGGTDGTFASGLDLKGNGFFISSTEQTGINQTD